MQSLVLRVRDCVCVCVNTVVRVRGASVFMVQPIPADMRLRISIGMPNFEMPNLDSVNFCTTRV